MTSRRARLQPALQARYDAVRSLDDKAFRSACYAPFVSLYLTSQGLVLACCRNGTTVLGDIRQQRLSEVWSGDMARRLRASLREYRFGGGCEYCHWEIGSGSFRTATPLLFDELPVASEMPEWPLQLEIDGSNTCNFECIMCNGNVSSAIRARRDGLPPLPKVYGEEFFRDLRPFLPHLRRARFFGGEPFLTPEARRIWTMLVDDGLRPAIHVTTNGSQYNRNVERYLDALPFHIVVSLDGATKTTVEAIRVNCRHEVLLENIARFHAYAQQHGTSFRLAFCLMRQNWRELLDVLIYAEHLGIQVSVNTVIDPSFCSLYSALRCFKWVTIPQEGHSNSLNCHGELS